MVGTPITRDGLSSSGGSLPAGAGGAQGEITLIKPEPRMGTTPSRMKDGR